MSHAAAAKAISALQEVAVDVLWRQWRAVGGSATSKESWHAIVDPEALVLSSLFLAEHEPRLADILSSWVELNAPLLSAQRMKNAQKHFPTAVAAHVATFVSKARQLQKHPRWHTLAIDEDPQTTAERPDVLRATRAPRSGTATLMLRLRAALSVGVKADVLTVLLGSARPVSVRELVDTLGYTDVGTRLAVEDLAYAGFATAGSGRPAQYFAPQAPWQTLLEIGRHPTWTPWILWFALSCDLFDWHAAARAKDVSDYALDVGFRERLKAHAAFFRLTAPELRPAVFEGTLGSSTAAIEAITAWGHQQAGESA